MSAKICRKRQLGATYWYYIEIYRVLLDLFGLSGFLKSVANHAFVALAPYPWTVVG